MVSDARARVLIADTDPGLRRQLHKRLLQMEVLSDCVSDGRAAVENLREQSYSVVLVDRSLPQAAAEQILDCIRNVAADSRPVVLVLAAGTGARSVDVDLVQIVLRKPCNIAQLADLVRSCVTTATRITSPVVCRSPLPQLS